MENHRFALRLLQPLERRPHVIADLDLFQLFVGRRHSSGRLGRRGNLRRTPPRAHRIHRPVVGDRTQPETQLGTNLERPQSMIGFHKGHLRHVLGIVEVADPGHGNAKDSLFVALDDSAERFVVAFAGSGDQFPVFFHLSL